MGLATVPAFTTTRTLANVFVQAAGTWDPMPWHIDRAYKSQGSDAQHAFWGADDELSMIKQMALSIA